MQKKYGGPRLRFSNKAYGKLSGFKVKNTEGESTEANDLSCILEVGLLRK